MDGRQEVCIPRLRARVRQIGRKHDKGRKVLVLGAQAVTDPRANARTLHGPRTGVNAGRRLEVLEMLGLHRTDDAKVIDALRQVWKQFADLGAALAVLLEFELRAKES